MVKTKKAPSVKRQGLVVPLLATNDPVDLLFPLSIRVLIPERILTLLS
jgi:hypothetical protein